MKDFRILHLTLKRKWFDMIESGEKREEYREIKPYWDKRLQNREYDLVCFRNGYHKDAPRLIYRVRYISRGWGCSAWGAPGVLVYIIGLGEEFVKYAVHPGPIVSKRDRDHHFVGYHQLIRLYGVNPHLCFDARYGIRADLPGQKIIHLYPKYSGKYELS